MVFCIVFYSTKRQAAVGAMYAPTAACLDCRLSSLVSKLSLFIRYTLSSYIRYTLSLIIYGILLALLYGIL